MPSKEKPLRDLDRAAVDVLLEGIESKGLSRRALADQTGIGLNRLNTILNYKTPPISIGEMGSIAAAVGSTAARTMDDASQRAGLGPSAVLDDLTGTSIDSITEVIELVRASMPDFDLSSIDAELERVIASAEHAKQTRGRALELGMTPQQEHEALESVLDDQGVPDLYSSLIQAKTRIDDALAALRSTAEQLGAAEDASGKPVLELVRDLRPEEIAIDELLEAPVAADERDPVEDEDQPNPNDDAGA